MARLEEVKRTMVKKTAHKEKYLGSYLKAKKQLALLDDCMKDLKIMTAGIDNSGLNQLYQEYKEQAVQAVQTMQEVFDCIRKVEDPRSANILTMLYILGYSIREISAELGLSYDYAGTLHQKALEMVQLPSHDNATERT